MIRPETAHPAFAKAGHLFGVEMRVAPVDPVTTQVDLDWVADHIDANTVALMGSAPNYGYGTIDPIARAGRARARARRRPARRRVPRRDSSCPSVANWATPSRPSTSRCPGSRPISADTHKYGYALKGTSVLCFADQALRNSQYFFQTDWSGGKYCSPGMDGSRSGGLLAATWAAMVSLGRAGYRGYAKRIFETSAAMQDAVPSHPTLRIMGRPSFLFSFTSDEFDIYLVNDFLRTRGLAPQRPAVPQRAAHGGHAAPDPARGRRALARRPRRRRRLRERAPRRAGEVGRDLRRRRRRHDAPRPTNSSAPSWPT